MPTFDRIVLSMLLAIVSVCGCPARAASDDAQSDSSYAGVQRRAIAVVQAMGDDARIAADYAPLRAVVDDTIAETGANADTTLLQQLDQHFTPNVIAPYTLGGFANGLHGDFIVAAETWAADARMRAINAAIRDFVPGSRSAADVVPAARMEMLLRLQDLMHLRDQLRAQISARSWVQAAAFDALHPSGAELEQFRNSRPAYPLPEGAALVAVWLAPALENASDDDIRDYLAFAESQPGNRYFGAYLSSYSPQIVGWFAALADIVKNNSTSHAVPAPSPAQENVAALIAQARTLVRTGGPRGQTDARALLLQAAATEPRNAEVQSLLGEIAFNLRPGGRPSSGQVRVPADAESFAEAEAYFRKAIELDPAAAESKARLGYALFLQGKDEEARALYEQAERIDPDTDWLQLNFADLDQATGRNVQAIDRYTTLIQAAATAPNQRAAAFERSFRLFASEERVDDYVTLVNAYLRAHPDDYAMRATLADHLLEARAGGAAVLAVLDPLPAELRTGNTPLIRAVALVDLAGKSATNGRLDAPGQEQIREAIALVQSTERLVELACHNGVSAKDTALLLQVSGPSTAAATTLLACAVLSKDFETARAMVDAGGDIDARLGPPWSDTLLAVALMNSEVEIFEAVLALGADRELPFRDGRSARDALTPPQTEAHRKMLALLDRESDSKAE